MEYKGKATIVQHCAAFGRLEKKARWVRTSVREDLTKTVRLVHIDFIEPRKRTGGRFTMTDHNTRYATIHDEAGALLYDSRSDLPCDMEKWQGIRNDMGGRPAFTTVKHPN